MVNQEDINFQKEEYEKKLGTIKELLKNKEKNLEETNSELQLLNQKLIILHNSRIRRIINPAKKGKINLKIADCLKTINKLNDEISEMIKEKANILGKLEANKKVVNMEEIGGLEEVLTVINEEDQQELEEVTTNAQEYINQKYPTPKDKANCRVLDISSYHWQHNSQGRKEKLTGSLSLQGFINLKQLNCSFNQISEIDVNDCHQLEMFICSHNRLTKLDCTGLDKLRIIICTSNLLTSLDHSFLNSAKLISLSISNNSFPKQDLSVFSKFTNLQYLGIGNDNEMFNNDTYNRFYGSLDPLKSLTKLDCLEINNTDVDSGLEYLSDNIQTICCHFGFRPESKVRKIAEQLSANDLFFFDGESYKKKWENTHPDFTPEIQKEWEEQGFNYKQTKEWIDAGIKITDADLARYLVAKGSKPNFAEWLKIAKNNKDPELILNHSDKEKLRKEYMQHLIEVSKGTQISTEVIKQIKDFSLYFHSSSEQRTLVDQLILSEKLRERYKKYGLCNECQQPNTGLFWCHSCNSQHFEQNFKNWTSGSQEIDEVIQTFQLIATSPYGMLEWIPYEQFSDSKYLAEGGFGKVYVAEWGDKGKVALKILNSSQGMSADFLQEITFHKLASGTSSFFNFIVRCFGISRDPKTNNYIMVTEYIEGGDLRKYLKEKYNRLTFRNKLNNLLSIAEGLNYIHRAKLIHKDLHAGNILNNKGKSYITDLGLCRPADEPSEGKIFGVLPYVAPEVLTGKPYTQASDVYSFGIVAHKLFSGLLPYHDIPDTELLALRICQGLRPNSNAIQAPHLIKCLIKQCWDSDPKQRPTANEIYEILSDWERGRDKNFSSQLEKWEGKNKSFVEVEALQGQESDEKERLGLHAVSEVNKQFNLDKYFHSLLKQNATPLITDLEEEEIQTKVKEGQVPLEFAEFSKKDLHFQNSLNACLEFFEREWSLPDETATYKYSKWKWEEEREKNLHNWKENQSFLIYPTTTYASRLLYFKNLPKPQNSKEINEQFWNSKSMEFKLDKLDNYLKAHEKETSWQNINPNFTEELIQSWQSHNFTPQQTQNWINIGLQPTDYNFCSWLRDTKRLTPEQTLNHYNLEQLNQEFFTYWQEQQQAQIEQPPK